MVTFHVLALGFVLGVSTLADKEALAWFLGKKETLDKERMQQFHSFMWLGLFAMLATGLYMMWPARESLLSDPLFLTKMFFVALLVINAVLIGKFMHVAFEKSYASLTSAEKLPLILSGGASTLGWIGAASIALWMF